jgi:hypothetical protein
MTNDKGILALLWCVAWIGVPGGETMKVLEGNVLKSKLTGTVFEVKRIKDKSVVLESKEGVNQEWTDMGNLPLFFEEAENQSSL